MKKFRIKNVVLLVFIFSILFGIFLSTEIENKNENMTKIYTYNLNLSDDLRNQVDEELESLNSNNLDEILSSLSDEQKNIFEDESVVDKIKSIISNEEGFDLRQVFKLVFSLFSKNLTGVIPILASICSIAILSNILLQMRGLKMNKSLADIIHFACFGVIVVLVFGGVVELVKTSTATLQNLKQQMEISFPILLTLMASLGSTTSVAMYQPLLAILCGAMMHVFVAIVFPIFSLTLIFNVVGNLTNTVKLSKISGFLTSLFKTIIGFSFTIFAGFVTLSGIVAGNYDGISIRTTKFAVKSYVPLVGGYLSDGFGLIMASNVLIKNALGYVGIIVLFLTIISPLIKIYLYKLGLALVSGIIEPVADKKVTEFVSSTSKSLSMLSSIILAFSFAYIICVGLIMCSSNLV